MIVNSTCLESRKALIVDTMFASNHLSLGPQPPALLERHSSVCELVVGDVGQVAQLGRTESGTESGTDGLSTELVQRLVVLAEAFPLEEAQERRVRCSGESRSRPYRRRWLRRAGCARLHQQRPSGSDVGHQLDPDVSKLQRLEPNSAPLFSMRLRVRLRLSDGAGEHLQLVL